MSPLPKEAKPKSGSSWNFSALREEMSGWQLFSCSTIVALAEQTYCCSGFKPTKFWIQVGNLSNKINPKSNARLSHSEITYYWVPNTAIKSVENIQPGRDFLENIQHGYPKPT